MKNKHTLLTPELRKMLAAGESKTLRYFSQSDPPGHDRQWIFPQACKTACTPI